MPNPHTDVSEGGRGAGVDVPRLMQKWHGYSAFVEKLDLSAVDVIDRAHDLETALADE